MKPTRLEAGPSQRSCRRQAQPTESQPGTGTAALSQSVGFELLGDDLGRDVESCLKSAIAGGAVFQNETDPISVFRASLDNSIRNIESHPRGELFQRFLLEGPYEDAGEIPAHLRGERLTDDETTSIIAFIYAHMVNSFKGSLTELFASAPCLLLLRQLQQSGQLPHDARLYIGDAIGVLRASGRGSRKGADIHILEELRDPDQRRTLVVHGVGEVKSYFPPHHRLREQIDRHLARIGAGLCVNGVKYPPKCVTVRSDGDGAAVCVTVVPDRWKLPRDFRFETSPNGRVLQTAPMDVSARRDEIVQTGSNEWRITLKWSKEAIASAAYEMTFWYMEKVGECIYAQAIPDDWANMSPAEAGRNAAKMMLYYAILRCRTARENQRAIALYNTYSFGYALGMNYRNAQGTREMLWPEDLDEILAAGKTKGGCRIVG